MIAEWEKDRHASFGKHISKKMRKKADNKCDEKQVVIQAVK